MPWRDRVRDEGVDVALALAVGALAVVDVGMSEPWTSGAPLRVAAASVVAGLVLLRRAAPVPAHVGLCGLIALQVLLVEPAVGFGLFVAVFATSYTAARSHGWPGTVIALSAIIALVAALGATAAEEFEYPFPLFMFGSAALLGAAVRRSDRRRAELADLAERLSSQQAELARLAVADERARIARDLHDVVAHCVTSVVVQAGAAAEVVTVDPPRAAALLEGIESAGRTGLSELRSMLRALDPEVSDNPAPPQPTLGDLTTLAAAMALAGVTVDLDVDADPVGLPPGVQVAAYRIVQEALTNTLKHAGPIPVVVRVHRRPVELVIDVVDGGPAAPTPGRRPAMAAVVQRTDAGGHGLVGMRERAAVYGGVVTAGPRPSGGFAVHATLPLEVFT